MLTLTKDRALALALLLIVAVMWVESGSIRPPTSWQPYGSALFPRILLVTIALLSLLLLARTFFTRVATPYKPWPLAAKEWLIHRKTIVALFLFFGLYAALLPIVGYITATISFLVVSLALLLGIDTKRKWIINLGISCTFAPLVFVIFRYGLNVWLP
ncbi:tripartite tricarboxylate transporter TctB family protein [Vreelandella olivaria]|uniref:tripartite tricarboxylate transporter TctB family protein n=1 Tax=Vreelandella olivaria TaxID=390919 RepID=UPI00201FAB73|nr:tripartite tricarboxylate transporter TctB family protein [Halomonas olivaria]